MHENKASCMRTQLIGLGNVGKCLMRLLAEKTEALQALGIDISVVSISDSKGTAISEEGLDPAQVLECKRLGWKGFKQYIKGYSALEAIRQMDGDVVLELTPSTRNGEPGLSNIEAALSIRKNVVTANKTPLAIAFGRLMKLAERNEVKLLYEATVAAHLPVFCLVDSCFKADELLSVQGILNSTTNFIISEIERGTDFRHALNRAIESGWTEVDYSDDVDGIDAARKVVILANSLFKQHARIDDVRIQGIENVEKLVKLARKKNKKAKLICEILTTNGKLNMIVAPKLVSLDDPLATINEGDMGIKFTFKTSQQIFVSAQFSGPMQTAYAVLNDIIRIQACTKK
jgi:homoserine dehydrogenase